MNEQLARTIARRAAALCAVAMALVAGACGGAGAPATQSATATVGSSPALVTAATSTPPATSFAATTSPAPASASATPSAGEVDAPPFAQLELRDGTVVLGYLGSWCYEGTCLDGPPPAKADLPLVELTAGEAEIAFALADTHPFGHATASYASDHDAEQMQLVELGEYYDPYLGATPDALLSTFAFDAPPNGDWVVRVSLQFGDRGDAVYYWRVVAG